MIKNKLTKNLGLKVMALIFSVLLWLIVVNVDDPVVMRTFTDIQVTLENEDVITQQGNVYQVLDGQTVTAVISARRSVLQDIDSEDIIATADIMEMDTDTGLIPVEISVADLTAGRDYQTAESVPNNLRINVEKSGKKVLSLTANTSDVSTRDGYIIGSTTVSPERVTITGAESQIEEIDRAVAYVEASGLSEDTDLTAELMLLDSDGNILDQNQLTNNLGEDGITVHLEILGSKTVQISFGVSGTPAEGYQYAGVTSEPESVVIYGTEEVLSQIDTIDIPDSEINIDGATENVEVSIDITSYLPEGASLGDEATGTVIATALIEEEGVRTIDFLVSSIRIDNLSDDLQVSYQADAEVSLQFRGDQERLDTLDIRNAVSVDLSSYTEAGTYEVPVEVIVPDEITYVEGATVSLTLSEKSDDSDQETDSQQENDSGTDTSGQQEESAQQEEEEQNGQ